MADEDGARIYRRSLTFLLELAFKRCFANGLLTIDYSVSSGGYYCQVDNLPEFGPENLLNLRPQCVSWLRRFTLCARHGAPGRSCRLFY